MHEENENMIIFISWLEFKVGVFNGIYKVNARMPFKKFK